MLIVNQLSGFGGRAINDSLHDILLDLGLTSNLEICLDAGSAASYASGQKWLDLTANGVDLFRGADGSSSTDDPTFNGTAGGLSSSEYWSFDGADFFRYDTSNETWMNNIHKNNAKYSFLMAIYPQNAGLDGLIGTNGGGGTDNGFYFAFTSGKLTFRVNKDPSGAALQSPATDDVTSTGDWHIIGLSVDEAVGSGGAFFYEDGAYKQTGTGNDTFTSTYDTPDTADAGFTMEIGALGPGAGQEPLANGTRLACFAIWEGTVLTKADFDAIYAALAPRFGL